MQIMVWHKDGRAEQLDVTKAVVMQSGTPLFVAGEYGGSGLMRISHVGEDDFAETLQVFGLQQPLKILNMDQTPRRIQIS